MLVGGLEGTMGAIIVLIGSAIITRLVIAGRCIGWLGMNVLYVSCFLTGETIDGDIALAGVIIGDTTFGESALVEESARLGELFLIDTCEPFFGTDATLLIGTNDLAYMGVGILTGTFVEPTTGPKLNPLSSKYSCLEDGLEDGFDDET